MMKTTLALLLPALLLPTARAEQPPREQPSSAQGGPLWPGIDSEQQQPPSYQDKKANLKRYMESWQGVADFPEGLPPEEFKRLKKKNPKYFHNLVRSSMDYRDMYQRVDQLQDGDEDAYDKLSSRFMDWKEHATDLVLPEAEDFIHRTPTAERGRFTHKLPDEFLHALDESLYAKHKDSLTGETTAARLAALKNELQQTEDQIGPLAKYFDGGHSLNPRDFAPAPSYTIPSVAAPSPRSYGSQWGPTPPEIPMPAVNMKDLPALDDNMEPFIRYMSSFGACKNKPDIVREIFKTAKFLNMNMNETLQAMGMISQESSCNPREYASNRYGGARGLTQIIEETGKAQVRKLHKMGYTWVPEYNNQIAYDVKYNLLLGLTEFKSDLDKYGFRDTLVAYNAGPGRVGSAHLPAETLDYIPKVTGYYRDYLAAAARYQSQIASAK